MGQGDVVIVPHGTGIGDMVNFRPLAAAIRAHFPDRRVEALVPPGLAWLLPDGILPSSALSGASNWQRMPADHSLAPLLGHLSVGTIGAALRAVPARSLSAGLTWFLQRQGYEVISLLDAFLALDLDSRWTPGPWNHDPAHLIDLLAATLERRGIAVPARRPRLSLIAEPAGEAGVLLAPGAGSTLKELPVRFWQEVARRLLGVGVIPSVLPAPGSRAAGDIAAVEGVILLPERPLPHVAALVAGTSLIIAPDTGILHLASALDIPSVGLFGSTDPRFLGPYPGGPGVQLLAPGRHEPVCRRCWTGQLLPRVRCPLYAQGSCLSSFDPGVVVRAALGLLEPVVERLPVAAPLAG